MHKIILRVLLLPCIIACTGMICDCVHAIGGFEGAIESEEEIPEAAEASLESTGEEQAAGQGSGLITWADSAPSADTSAGASSQ